MTTENSSSIIKSLPNDLRTAKELVYDKCGLKFSNPKMNPESKEYDACSFELDGHMIQHRASNITPTKTGQFVTIWKRNDHGITAPFDTLDNLDFVVITAKSGDQIGQFIFPRSVLAEKGIMSQNGKGGKRGIRVYPPWDTAGSKTAEKTQQWQTKYFLMLRGEKDADLERAKELFSICEA